MPVQRILIGVIEIDTVVVVRLLGLAIRLAAAKPGARPVLGSKRIVLLGLPVLLIAAERIAGRSGPSIVRLPGSDSVVISSGAVIGIGFGSAINVRVVVWPVLARHRTICGLLVLPVFRCVMFRFTHGAPHAFVQ